MYSEAAPNLTHLMTRNTFAGATWDLLTQECRDRVWNASPEEFGDALPARASPPSASTRSTCASGSATRRRRSRCTPKPTELGPTDGKTRGMPYLALSEDQIDELIAYLLERH